MVAPCPGRARQAPSPWGDHYVRASPDTDPLHAIAPLVDHHPMGLGRPYVDGFALASASVADVETPLGCAAVLVGCVALGAVVVVARAADP